MRLFRKALPVVALSTLMLASGCFTSYDYNSANNYGSRREMPRQDTSRAYQTKQQYSPVSHEVTKLDMNQFLSDQVQAMDGVHTAIVMMGDNTAYVAITLDNTASGTRGGGDKKPADGGGLPPEPPKVSPSQTTADHRYDEHDRSIDPNYVIPGLPGAATESHHEHLSHLFKQKIAEKIRMLQPSVVDVYISANGVFVDTLTKLAQESWHGRSLEPYRAEFIQLATQIFGTGVTIPTQSENNGREY